MRKLTVDIGNTRLKAAIFDGKRPAGQAVFERPSFGGLAGWLAGFPPVDGCIVSNVGGEEAEIMAFLQRPFFLELGPATRLPFVVKYKTPQTLGKDRLAAVAGAQALFTGRDCLVIDAGTCLKFDLLTGDGDHLGGNIAPGARMRLRAMHEQTARLPLVEMAWPESEIGDSTEAALQNGGLLGMLFEIRAMAAFCRKRWPRLTVVLTGGDAEFFFKRLKIKGLRLEKDLVAVGLAAILDHNFELGTSQKG